VSEPQKRATRRNLSTQPIPRGIMGPPTAGQVIRFTPIAPDELADIITQARKQRAYEDSTPYELRKAS
jgi:hypothetical protein